VHDCLYFPHYNKIVTAADDNCIAFHDYGTTKCDIRLSLGDQVPLSIDLFHHTEDGAEDTMLIYGTDTGIVGIINFSCDVLFSQKRTINLDQFARAQKSTCTVLKKKTHNDWVLKVKYYSSIRSIISCSKDPQDSLVVGKQQLGGAKGWAYSSVPVNKGVNCFAYCNFPSVLVTAGTDRQLRIWNIHRLLSPMAAMRGHLSPVIDVCINESSAQIISLSIDKQIRVWDIREQTCVQTLIDPYTHFPENIISSIHFKPAANGGTLLSASSTITPYQLQANHNGPVNTKSHEFSIRSAIYNPEFGQVVSGCDGGIVNVWDPADGQKSFRLKANTQETEITAMSFDNKFRRLITGDRKGEMRFWNYNNGQTLHKLEGIGACEITGIDYIEMKESQYIVATGWCRRIMLYKDDESKYILTPDKIIPSMEDEPWHSEDILTLAYGGQGILATGSLDGEICICNLNSGSLV
jgi:WD40 repeat protein